MQTYTTAPSTIIPMSTTPPTAPPTAPPIPPPTPPPTAPPTAVISTLSVTGPMVVGLTHSVCAINESTSIGQLGYTLVMLPWTTIDL